MGRVTNSTSPVLSETLTSARLIFFISGLFLVAYPVLRHLSLVIESASAPFPSRKQIEKGTDAHPQQQQLPDGESSLIGREARVLSDVSRESHHRQVCHRHERRQPEDHKQRRVKLNASLLVQPGPYEWKNDKRSAVHSINNEHPDNRDVQNV